METEVKLGFKDKTDLFKVCAGDFFRRHCLEPEDPKPVLLENKYLDTEDLFITKRGGSLRVRHYAGSDEAFYEFTVKYGGGTTGGLHKRLEWNVRSNDGNFSIASFKNNASGADSLELLNEVFADITDSDLKVVCSNSFNRTVYELSFGLSRIEACFDSGVITSSDGSKTDEICELELELISGDEKDLTSLADQIKNEADCMPLCRTKYIRTLAMAIGDEGL